MSGRNWAHRVGLWVLFVTVGLVATGAAQVYQGQPARDPRSPPTVSAGQPAYRAWPAQPSPPIRQAQAVRPAMADPSQPQPPQPAEPPRLQAGRPDEHPLMPSVRWARESYAYMEQNVRDYSAIMVKQERHGGKLWEPEYIFLKVRHKPLSVYMRFLKPASMQGQEVIYVDGWNDGKMVAHGVGVKKVFGALSLDPTGSIAMHGNHYPITEVGLLNLIKRLGEQGEKDARYGECEVHYVRAKVDKRDCLCIEVVHPRPRSNFLFNVARIFVDEQYHFPLRYEAYDWPGKPGGKPELIEEYTYLDLKLNVGFTDADFDVRNPAYQFQSHPQR